MSDFFENKLFWEQNSINLFNTSYSINNIIHSISSTEKLFLEDINGKNVLHIFCNFGMNTFYLESLGTKVTGLDYNKHSIEFAEKYKEKINSEVEFICDDFFNYSSLKKYDVIYASFGVIDWVSDLDLFIDKIYNLLNDNGKFIFIEFHSDFFKQQFLDMGGVEYKDNQYKIKTSYTLRKSESKKSLLGNGATSIEDVYMKPYLHDTDIFVSKVKQKFNLKKLDFFKFINFKMGNDVNVGANRWRNKYLKKSEYVSYGLIGEKK